MSDEAAGLRLTLISYPSQMDVMMEAAALRAHASDLEGPWRFGRAQTLDDVPYALANLAPVSRLDLVGHGGPGWMRLGDSVLYTDNPSSWAPLKRFAERLRPGGTIRLLGCITALYPQTQEQLRKMARVVGCTLIGTTAPITPRDFGAQGLLEAFTERFTFSTAQPGVAHYPLPLGGAGAEVGLPGYVSHGESAPIAPTEHRLQWGARTVNLSCGNRVLHLSRDGAAPPRTYLWVLPGPAPSLATLEHALGRG